MALLPEGIPDMQSYERLVGSQRFAEIEEFSSRFVTQHRVADPLGQWSRRWEYAFALEALEEHRMVDGADRSRVLDAGCGFTFFPFLVAARLPQATITCVDADRGLTDVFDAVAAEERESVAFRVGDLTALPEPDESYDAIVCVSVLEHVRDRHAALRELRRVVRPGGLVVLTFDVAIDSDYEIPITEGERLLSDAAGVFGGRPVAHIGCLAERGRGNVLTTRRVAQAEPWRMPWRNRLVGTLSSLRRGFVPRSFGYPKLTVWCGRLVRP